MIHCRKIGPANAVALRGVLEDAEEDPRRLHAALVDPANTVYRLDDEDTTVGAAVVAWRRSHHELLYIGVADGRRGQGLGRRLIERIVSDLEDNGGTLEVGTANSSLDNIAFYQRVGFRMAVVRRDFFGYVDPGVEEFGIPMRDMIVFERSAVAAPSASGTSGELVGRPARMLLLPGSTRPDSTNVAALRTVRALFAGTVLFEGLADVPPLVPGDEDGGHSVQDLRDRLGEAELVVISTPEYAGSLPGTFKNLLDWTVGGGDLYRKPVVWLNAAAPGRGDGASAELEKVLGYVDARVLRPGGIKIPVPRDAISSAGVVEDDGFRAALIRELAPVLREVQGDEA